MLILVWPFLFWRWDQNEYCIQYNAESKLRIPLTLFSILKMCHIFTITLQTRKSSGSKVFFIPRFEILILQHVYFLTAPNCTCGIIPLKILVRWKCQILNWKALSLCLNVHCYEESFRTERFWRSIRKFYVYNIAFVITLWQNLTDILGSY